MSVTQHLVMPKKGDFQHVTTCGPFEPLLDDLTEDRGYHGLSLEGTYFYGTVRDRAGNMYTLLRRLPSHVPAAMQEAGASRKGVGRRLMYQSNVGKDALRLDVDVIKAAGVSDGYETKRTADSLTFAKAPAAEGKPWSVALTTTTMDWQEEGVFSLRGTMLPLALQWYLIDRDDSLYYGSRNYHVVGTVKGEPVEGFIFIEQPYMPEGGRLYAHRDSLMGQKIEICWYSWGTRWDDGSIECGHFIGGNDRAGFGMAAQGDKITLLTSAVTAEVNRASDGYWHDGIRLDANGEAWEIVADPRGRQVDMNQLANPQQEGLVRRVGETRKPVAWFAWGETSPSHGDKGVNRYAI